MGLLDGKRVTTSKGAFPAMKQWRPGAFGPVGRGGEYLDELRGMCGHGSDVCVYQGRLRGGCSKGGQVCGWSMRRMRMGIPFLAEEPV
jgi:hypothetical protein